MSAPRPSISCPSPPLSSPSLLQQREAEEQVDEIQKRLLAKEGDLTRIRSQREDFRAEATELRARESEKVKNLDQLKTLAQSREDRIAAYASEVRRLKMQIAAAEGDAATVDAYAATVDAYAGAEEGDIVKDLQGRLKCVSLPPFRLGRES